MHRAGKNIAEEILEDAQLGMVARGNSADDASFGPHRGKVWEQLRKHFPEKMDPSRLEGEMLGEGECPTKFLHSFQRKWKDATGSVWNANDTTRSLFKMMVKKAMPPEVQTRLDSVVGLMKMEWPLFSEHIVHHVENYKKEKRKEKEVNTHLVNKLTQLQLNELTKPKKDKAKPQAPVITVGEIQPTSQAPTPPAPIPRQPPQNPQRATPETNAATPLPPIHVHVNQPPPYNAQDGNYWPRGRPGMRGRQGRYRGRGGMFQQNLSHAQSTPNLAPLQQQPQMRDDVCWGCEQPGYRRRDCPVNP